MNRHDVYRLNLLVRLMTNSALRAFSQRNIETPLLLKMAGHKEYPLCLEIGCGRGVGAEIIIERFGAQKVVATDIDLEQIERARRRLSGTPELSDKVELKVTDAMALDEPSGHYDAVFAFGVVHHTEDWRKTLKEVSRVLKTGGEFFFLEFLSFMTKNTFLRTLFKNPKGGIFSFEEFKTGLGESGINLTGAKRINNIVVLGVGRKEMAA